jgi:hypothetical protein
MTATEQLEIIAITIIKPARAAGMSDEEAEAVYCGLMECYCMGQGRKSTFCGEFLDLIQHAIDFARGGDCGTKYRGGLN